MNRNILLGVRTTTDFVNHLDSLCDRFGHSRSTVVRYALRKFVNESKDLNIFNKIRSELI
jgi:metal-responsive CopG/Arc/MetJ family transcriptional regulator